jgi:hypothetical protein
MSQLIEVNKETTSIWPSQEASVGLMIWDGKSTGTLANAARLLRQDKKVVVYAAPAKRFLTLKAEADWECLLFGCGSDVREKVLQAATGPRRKVGGRQRSLF